MKVGARVTLYTTLVMAAVLGLTAYAGLHVRRLDLEEDLQRQARDMALGLRAVLEPVDPALARVVLEERVERAQKRGLPFQLEVLRLGDRHTTDSGWLNLMDRVEATQTPVGRFFTPEGRPPFFAMAFPLYGPPPSDAAENAAPPKPVAVMGLKRDTAYIQDEVAATARRILPSFMGALLALGVSIALLLRRSVLRPLRFLRDSIDAVRKGDLSRVLFAERDDEVGRIAAHFNAMTAALREAREENQRASRARLALENRLHQSEKLATMGQMAAEIAHEVGTPLAVIGGRARALQKKSGDAVEVEKNAGIIVTQVDRIAKIIRQVLDFSRQGAAATGGQADLRTVVGEALDFLNETRARQGVDTELRFQDVPAVAGDADQIQQVCLNLLTNALQAMPQGGRLRVGLDLVVRRKEGLDLAPPSPYVVLEVADTGPGIPLDHRDKVFEPFFTTKEGQGTGLGLAVSRGIIKDHDGWIEVDSPPEGGALFRVFLPAAEGSLVVGAAPQEPARGGAGERTPTPAVLVRADGHGPLDPSTAVPSGLPPSSE